MSVDDSLARVIQRVLFRDRHDEADRDDAIGAVLAAMALVRASEGKHALWAESGSWLEGIAKHHADVAAAAAQLGDATKLEELATELRPAMVRRRSPDVLRRQVVDLLARTRGSSPDAGTLKLAARLVGDLRGGFLVDPSCGSGIVLALAALETAERTGKPVRAWGVAATEKDAALATVVCFLLGVDAVIHRTNDTDAPEPLGGAVWAAREPARDVDAPTPADAWTTAGRAWSRLPVSGRAVLLLPSRRVLAERGAGAGRRHELAEAGAIVAVIELPALPWSRTSHARGAVVVLERSQPEAVRAGIVFVRPRVALPDDEARSNALDDDDVDAIARALAAPPASGAQAEDGSFVVTLIAHDEVAKSDHLDPSFWLRGDIVLSLDEALERLAAAEAEERRTVEQAAAALLRYRDTSGATHARPTHVGRRGRTAVSESTGVPPKRPRR